MSDLRIGTAGWSIPRQDAHAFPAEGSSLERYAARFNAVEINSSFHRPHRPATWLRWRDSAPAGLRFSVKLAKEITHERKLRDCAEPLARFLDQVDILGDKLAGLLVQLPPKHEFNDDVAGAFFEMLRQRSNADIVCEPRHPSWFTPAAEALMVSLKVARVAADPAICDDAGVPGGWRGLSYWRLHGSPVMYPVQLPRPDPSLRRAATAGGQGPPARMVHLRQHGVFGRSGRCVGPDGRLCDALIPYPRYGKPHRF